MTHICHRAPIPNSSHMWSRLEIPNLAQGNDDFTPAHSISAASHSNGLFEREPESRQRSDFRSTLRLGT